MIHQQARLVALTVHWEASSKFFCVLITGTPKRCTLVDLKLITSLLRTSIARMSSDSNDACKYTCHKIYYRRTNVFLQLVVLLVQALMMTMMTMREVGNLSFPSRIHSLKGHRHSTTIAYMWNKRHQLGQDWYVVCYVVTATPCIHARFRSLMLSGCTQWKAQR